MSEAANGDISRPLTDIPNANSAPTPELARLHGYHCDIHTVITEDGYVLQVHRLPGGRSTPINCSLPPVLLIHGILVSSSCWLTAGPSQALAYLLADQGYDVWMNNIRGNTYGRQNIYFSVDDDAFWDFSWDRAGVNDLSATIDYILRTTGHEKVLVVAQSMGTTEFFALCSVRPEYNDKVQHMVALAPTAYLNYSPSLFTVVAPFGDVFELVLNTLTHGEFLPRNSIVANILKNMCALKANVEICESILFSLFGFDPVGFDENLLPIIYGHVPAGASAKTVLHFLQVVNSRRFQRFDYGPVKNLEVYDSIYPPEFNVSQISAPLSFIYSKDGDIIADPKDVMDLVSQLKCDVDVYTVNQTNFNHIDYLWAKNVKTLVYDKVLSIFETKQTLSRKTSRGLRV